MFEGVRGTGCCWGVLEAGDPLLCFGVEGLGDPLCSEATLFTASNFVAANGGGKGDMERPDTDALCARELRIGLSEGTESTCCLI